VLLNELGQLYKAYENGQEISIVGVTVQYAEYAVWQREWLKGEVESDSWRTGQVNWRSAAAA